jgi:Lon protease-like protein
MIEIPLFPLRNVLYPAGLLPLKVFEQRYLEMTKNCIRDDSVFGVCLIRDGAEVGTPAVPYATGCTARILEWDMPHLGLFQLICQGESVFRIADHWPAKNGLLWGHVELREPELQVDLPQAHQHLADLLKKIIDKIGADRFPAPVALHDASWVAYRLAEVLPIEPELKQHILEATEPEARLSALTDFLRTARVVV